MTITGDPSREAFLLKDEADYLESIRESGEVRLFNRLVASILRNPPRSSACRLP